MPVQWIHDRFALIIWPTIRSRLDFFSKKNKYISFSNKFFIKNIGNKLKNLCINRELSMPINTKKILIYLIDLSYYKSNNCFSNAKK